jgi:hypothetical protein
MACSVALKKVAVCTLAWWFVHGRSGLEKNDTLAKFLLHISQVNGFSSVS